MSNKNAKSQLNLAQFIDKAMNVRKTIIDLPSSKFFGKISRKHAFGH